MTWGYIGCICAWPQEMFWAMGIMGGGAILMGWGGAPGTSWSNLKEK